MTQYDELKARLRATIKWLERDVFLTHARNTSDALDAIESLERQLEKLRAELITAYGESEELSGQLAECKRDAERYRYIKNSRQLNVAVLFHEENIPRPICPGFGWKEAEQKDMDSAIDAAMENNHESA